jgi:hypothetical protein
MKKSWSGGGISRSWSQENKSFLSHFFFIVIISVLHWNHRHLSNIDCLKVHAASLVCFVSAVNGHHKKEKEALKEQHSSRHVTNLKQSILDFWYLFWQVLKQHMRLHLVFKTADDCDWLNEVTGASGSAVKRLKVQDPRVRYPALAKK